MIKKHSRIKQSIDLSQLSREELVDLLINRVSRVSALDFEVESTESLGDCITALEYLIDKYGNLINLRKVKLDSLEQALGDKE